MGKKAKSKGSKKLSVVFQKETMFDELVKRTIEWQLRAYPLIPPLDVEPFSIIFVNQEGEYEPALGHQAVELTPRQVTRRKAPDLDVCAKADSQVEGQAGLFASAAAKVGLSAGHGRHSEIYGRLTDRFDMKPQKWLLRKSTFLFFDYWSNDEDIQSEAVNKINFYEGPPELVVAMPLVTHEATIKTAMAYDTAGEGGVQAQVAAEVGVDVSGRRLNSIVFHENHGGVVAAKLSCFKVKIKETHHLISTGVRVMNRKSLEEVLAKLRRDPTIVDFAETGTSTKLTRASLYLDMEQLKSNQAFQTKIAELRDLLGAYPVKAPARRGNGLASAGALLVLIFSFIFACHWMSPQFTLALANAKAVLSGSEVGSAKDSQAMAAYTCPSEEQGNKKSGAMHSSGDADCPEDDQGDVTCSVVIEATKAPAAETETEKGNELPCDSVSTIASRAKQNRVVASPGASFGQKIDVQLQSLRPRLRQASVLVVLVLLAIFSGRIAFAGSICLVQSAEVNDAQVRGGENDYDQNLEILLLLAFVASLFLICWLCYCWGWGNSSVVIGSLLFSAFSYNVLSSIYLVSQQVCYLLVCVVAARWCLWYTDILLAFMIRNACLCKPT